SRRGSICGGRYGAKADNGFAGGVLSLRSGGRAARSFTEADQHIAVAVVKRMRVEKRSAFDLEPPIEGHRSFPKRFGGHGASRLASLLQCNTVRHGFTEYSARSSSVVVQQGSAPCRV